MDVLYTRCCGLDIHKKTVVACCIISTEGAEPVKETRPFRTMTADLLALADWLQEAGCTHVAMESTGVYWRPVYNLLEGQCELLVVNAQHIKAVPGRKTDVKDAAWIAELLRYGLLRGSFIPPQPQRQVRELTRYRSTLVQDRARTLNRLQAVLEDANLKLASVVTDIAGVSARAMLEAILAGQRDVETLADLARGRLRAKRDQLKEALEGRVTAHHSFLLTEHLSMLDTLDEAIEHVSGEIAQRLAADQEAIALLDTIPGIGQRAAENPHRRDWDRHESLSECQAPGLLGWDVSRQLREWGETFEREDPERESMVTAGADRNCPRCVQNAKHLSRRPIPTDCRTSREETGSGCAGAYHLDDRLYVVDTAATVPGSRGGVL